MRQKQEREDEEEKQRQELARKAIELEELKRNSQEEEIESSKKSESA